MTSKSLEDVFLELTKEQENGKTAGQDAAETAETEETQTAETAQKEETDNAGDMEKGI